MWEEGALEDPLPQLPRVGESRRLRAVECELCGESFVCKNGPGCWCTQVVVTKEKLAAVRSTAQDCVCPICSSGRNNNL